MTVPLMSVTVLRDRDSRNDYCALKNRMIYNTSIIEVVRAVTAFICALNSAPVRLLHVIV